MNINRTMRPLLLGALLVALAGCASSPVSKTLRQQAKPLTLAQVAANPSAYTGTIVIWGGRVIEATNDSAGARLYVLQLPLDRQDTPEWHAASSGRFIARSKDFLDPEVFRKGRLVTVAGEVTGASPELLQQVRYTYPVVAIKELHLWQIAVSPYGPGWYGPGWGWYGPWYGSGWGWYGPGYGPGWDWGWE